MTKVISKDHFSRLYVSKKDFQMGLVTIESCISTKEKQTCMVC